MYQTIRVSSCVLVQGDFVERLPDGQVVIRDGKTEYRGRPVPKAGFAKGQSSGVPTTGERLLHTP